LAWPGSRPGHRSDGRSQAKSTKIHPGRGPGRQQARPTALIHTLHRYILHSNWFEIFFFKSSQIRKFFFRDLLFSKYRFFEIVLFSDFLFSKFCCSWFFFEIFYLEVICFSSILDDAKKITFLAFFLSKKQCFFTIVFWKTGLKSLGKHIYIYKTCNIRIDSSVSPLCNGEKCSSLSYFYKKLYQKYHLQWFWRC